MSSTAHRVLSRSAPSRPAARFPDPPMTPPLSAAPPAFSRSLRPRRTPANTRPLPPSSSCPGYRRAPEWPASAASTETARTGRQPHELAAPFAHYAHDDAQPRPHLASESADLPLSLPRSTSLA